MRNKHSYHCSLEILVLFVFVINQDGVSTRLFAVFNKRFEDGLARLCIEKFNHAGKNIDILVRLTSLAAAFAIDLENEQRRMSLHKNALAFDNLRTAHVRTNLQARFDALLKFCANVIDNTRALFKFHVVIFLRFSVSQCSWK